MDLDLINIAVPFLDYGISFAFVLFGAYGLFNVMRRDRKMSEWFEYETLEDAVHDLVTSEGYDPENGNGIDEGNYLHCTRNAMLELVEMHGECVLPSNSSHAVVRWNA